MQSSFGRNIGGHQGGGEGKPEALAGTPGTWGLESKHHCAIQATPCENLGAWALRCWKTCPKLNSQDGKSYNLDPTFQMSRSELSHSSDQMTDFPFDVYFFSD